MKVLWIDRDGQEKQGESIRITREVVVKVLGDSKKVDRSKSGKSDLFFAPIMIEEFGIVKQDQMFNSPQKAGSTIKLDFLGHMVPDFGLFPKK